MPPPPNLPDTPEMRQDMAAFNASARSLDGGVGMVLSALEQLGLAEDTLVICTTDHGIAFPGTKATLTDRGIGVFLIMRGPGGFFGGQGHRRDGVPHRRLPDDLRAASGSSAPTSLQGQSLMPLVRGDATRFATRSSPRAPTTPPTSRSARCARSAGSTSAASSTATRRCSPNRDDSPSKDIWIEHGWLDQPMDAEQLYDLVFDPNEARNLASDPHLSTRSSDLRARLEEWMQETADPLLDGPVPPPPGAEFNDPDQLSPEEPTHIVAPLDSQGAT